MNLIGLTPYSFIVTSHFVVTLAISLSIFIGINIICIKTHKFYFFSLFLIGGILFLFILVPVLQFSFCVFVIIFFLIKYVGVIKFRKEFKSLYEYIICSANFLAVSDSTLDGLSNTVFGVGLACGPVIAIGCIAAYSYMFPSVGPLGNQHSTIIDGSTVVDGSTTVDGYINRMDEYPYSLHLDQKARVAEVFSNSDMATKEVYSKLLEISNSIANLHGLLVSPDVELHYPSYDPNLFSEFQHVLKDILPGLQNVLQQSLGIMSSLVNHFFFVAAQVQISEELMVVQDIVVTGDVAMWQQFLPHCLLLGLSLVTFFFPLEVFAKFNFNSKIELDLVDNDFFSVYLYFLFLGLVISFFILMLKDEQENIFSNLEERIQKTSQIFNPINQEILTLIDIFNKYYYLSYTILNGYKKHLNFIKYMLINSCIYKFLNKNKTYNFLLLKKN